MTTPTPPTSTEDRLRQALAEEAATVPLPPDRWEEIERRAGHARRRNRWSRNGFAALGVAATVAVALVTASALRDDSHDVRTTTPAGQPAAPEPTTSTTSLPAIDFPYQPLWPFRTQEEASVWQEAYHHHGQEPWHVDAGETALHFTRDYLGFTEIDRVIRSSIEADGREAHIAVGYPTEGGRTGTAADIHLARFGSGPDAPWEVVGTRDTDLVLTAPAYGSLVSSPMTVGGRITGVDEALHIEVRQVSSAGILGEDCCMPGGGVRMPWSRPVSFSGATDPVLTIVVSTGGHLQGIERFAVTGVRTR